MNTAVISLGSNIDPKTNIAQALQRLSGKFLIIREGTLIWTKPIGILDQPDFLNGAVLLETNLDLQNLQPELKAIEDSLGRKREGPKFGPRTIDLDIVVWNNQVVDQDFYQKDFLKKTVLDVLPELKY